MKPGTDTPSSTPTACPSCGSSDLEPFTLGAASGWWCHECGDMWEATARRPHPFDPMTSTGPDGPVVADWCARIGCAKMADDPIHVCGCGFGLPGYLGHDPACPNRTAADVAAARAVAARHPPNCACLPCLGKAAQP